MGHYSVKSAYAVIREIREGDSSSDNFGFWRKMWNLKIPLKVKHFVWRASNGRLPTKDHLLAKHVNVCHLCPVCNREIKTILHVLVTCRFASLCWKEANIWVDLQQVNNFLEHMITALQKHSLKVVRKIGMLAWAIWKNINDILWNQKGSEYGKVTASAFLDLNSRDNAQDRSFDSNLGS